MDVDGDRLKADITGNAAFGGFETDRGPGRTVLTGSEADRDCRDYLCERLREAECEVRVDPVGTIAGRWVPDGADPDAAPVAAGSHLDSVPRGGIFDGPLGVYGALEALRALQDADEPLDRPIEVISFTEEEGARFGVGLLGSAVAGGELAAGEALALADESGTSLEEHLEEIGYRGDATIDPARWAGWAELHVEQGARLQEAGDAVGVVETINGLTNCRIELEGETDHAGTTAMDRRRDALAAAASLILDIENRARQEAATDPSVVGTVGSLAVEPNAKNVVAGRTTIVSDFRAANTDAIDRLVGATETVLSEIEAEREVETSLDRYRDIPPTALSEAAIQAAIDGTENTGHAWQYCHSGALHDTTVVARQTDAALLFAPSKDGVSHSPAEWTDWADCARATEALAATIRELARAA